MSEHDPVDELRRAVNDAFGSPWSVEAASGGFVAKLPIGASGEPPGNGTTVYDEYRITVLADPATKRYSWSGRRIRSRDQDVTVSRLGHHSRRVRSDRYVGARRTFSFRRTPEGLVPDPTAPADSAAREADLRRVAADLGWIEEHDAASPIAMNGSLPPRRVLIGMGIFAGVVIVAIVGVAIVIVTQVLSSLRG